MTLSAPQDAQPSPYSKSSAGARDILLTRIYLPFAMVITFSIFLVVGSYTVGGVMSGIARDKTETEKRLTAIEKEVTAIKNILASGAPAPCLVRPK
jgi:hypothetical protein